MLTFRFILFAFLATSVSCQSFDFLLEFVNKDGTCKLDSLKNKLNFFHACLLPKISITSQGQTFDQLPVDEASEIVCQTNLTQCLVNLGNGLESCLSEERYKFFIENPTKSLSAMKEYACSDDRKPIKDFITNGMPCFELEPVAMALKSCPDVFLVNDNWFDNSTLSDACGVVNKWIKCIVDATDACEVKTAKNFAENLQAKWVEYNYC